MNAVTAYQQALRANERAEEAWRLLRERLKATAEAMERARPSSFLGKPEKASTEGPRQPFRFTEWPTAEDMVAAADALGGTRSAVTIAWQAIEEEDRIGLLAPSTKR
ncbi:MAG: hypothetical protein JWR77_1999 [Rhizorhabdus sp.]|nr:hypothetical protein [Rhizorhabdus sp.]